MMWSVIEHAATLIENIIYANFVVNFLEPKKKHVTVLSCIIIIFINTALTLVFNHFVFYEGFLGLIRICINYFMAVILFKGTTFEKIFTALFFDIVALITSFLTLKLLGLAFDKTIEEMILYRGSIRIYTLFIAKSLFFITTKVFIKIKKNKNYLLSIEEMIILGFIYVITTIIGMGLYYIDLKTEILSGTSITVYISLGLVLINILVYFLMNRISSKNEEGMRILIDKMQMESYHTQFKDAENQFEEIRKIRHDLKNHLQCISALINDEEYIRANEYISDMLENKLDFGIHYVKTNNRVIDAVSNAKISQCINENIDIDVKSGKIETSVDDIELCSILGNIFDNAIEACKNNKGQKKIFFNIEQKKEYINIIMKNTIDVSILENNPKLNTTKKQKDIHGYGVKTIRDIVSRHNGMMEFFEKDGLFIVDIWIPRNKIQ